MNKLTLIIRRGADFDIPIRVESDLVAFADITAITNASPVQITAPAHGLPNGWRARILNAVGLTELNTAWQRMRDEDLRRVAKIDDDTITLPGISSAGFRTYISGGQLSYYQPLDLSEFVSAAMEVRDQVDGNLLAEYNTENARLELDTTNRAVWVRLSAADASAIAAGNFVFDVELTRSSGDVVAICTPDSSLIVLPEITAA